MNARDAMPGGGALAIQTRLIDLDNDLIGANPRPVSGSHALITVTDTGSGIDREIIDQVFEPYFTTKKVGRGSGLGLSMVYGFVKQSAGNIDIKSGSGGTFIPAFGINTIGDILPGQGYKVKMSASDVLYYPGN